MRSPVLCVTTWLRDNLAHVVARAERTRRPAIMGEESDALREGMSKNTRS